MTELKSGTIPLTLAEEQALKTIPKVIGYSRTLPGEQGPLQVENADGRVYLIKGNRVEVIK